MTCARRAAPVYDDNPPMLTIEPPPAETRWGSAACATQIGAVKDRRDDLAPFLVIQLREVDFSSHRGVVDQDVEAPERINGRRDERRRALRTAHVRDLRRSVTARLANLTRDGFRFGCTRPRIHDDRRAGVCQRESDCAADVAALPVTTATRPRRSSRPSRTELRQCLEIRLGKELRLTPA